MDINVIDGRKTAIYTEGTKGNVYTFQHTKDQLKSLIGNPNSIHAERDGCDTC
jgi:hypothetical protein